VVRKIGWLGLAFTPLMVQAQALNPAQYYLLAEQSRTAFTVQGAGARAIGTGGAFIAVADDATAVSFNPAGLAQLLRPEVSLVGQGVSRDLSLTGFQGQPPDQGTTFTDTWSKNTHARPTFASFAVPWKRNGLNYTFLLSYQRLFDFTATSAAAYQGTASGGSTVQNVAQQVRQSGGIDLYSVALGAELSSRILVGIALNDWAGRSGFQYGSTAQTSGVGVPFSSVLAQTSEFRGINANLGLIWRSQWLNLGVVYRTPFTASYTFTNSYSSVDSTSFVPTVQTGPQTTSKVNWPETLGFGFGLHPDPRLLITADWSHTPWSRAHYSAPGTPYDGLNWFDYQNPTATRDTTDVHAGTEWIAYLGDSVVIPLRAGAFREPQPVVDVVTGTQRVLQGWTTGFGIKFKDLTFDLAYKYAHDQRYVSRYNTDAPVGGVAATGLGQEGLTERSLYVSLIYQLGAEAVRRALAWTFIGGEARP
jgi:hypothetical protein